MGGHKWKEGNVEAMSRGKGNAEMSKEEMRRRKDVGGEETAAV